MTDPTTHHTDRPHARYKAELRQRIAALGPRTLLDVGCGGGDLLRSPELADCPVRIGVDVAAAELSALRAAGLDVREGRGEALPFDDASFDVVVLDYVAHHLADLPTPLREAGRVTRHAVLVLDPWYDLSLPAQQVACDFDAWCKIIDRSTGMVHNPCPTPAELCAPFQAMGGFTLEHRLRLILQDISYEALVATAERQFALLDDRTAMSEALAPILRRATRDGVSQDGSILFVAERADR